MHFHDALRDKTSGWRYEEGVQRVTIRSMHGLVLFWIALGATPLARDHPFNAEYDFTKPVSLTGVVVKWELMIRMVDDA